MESNKWNLHAYIHKNISDLMDATTMLQIRKRRRKNAKEGGKKAHF